VGRQEVGNVLDLKLLLTAALVGVAIASALVRFGRELLSSGFQGDVEDLIAVSEHLKGIETSSKDQNHPSSPADSGKSRG
jgi:hypothetical protein